MPTDLAFCTTHRIAFNRRVDPTCPQCMLSRIAPSTPLDFDAVSQKPMDATGKLLDPFTLK